MRLMSANYTVQALIPYHFSLFLKAAYSTTAAYMIFPVFKFHIVLTLLSTEKAKFMFPLDLMHNLSFSCLILSIVGSSAHAA